MPSQFMDIDPILNLSHAFKFASQQQETVTQANSRKSLLTPIHGCPSENYFKNPFSDVASPLLAENLSFTGNKNQLPSSINSILQARVFFFCLKRFILQLT